MRRTSLKTEETWEKAKCQRKESRGRDAKTQNRRKKEEEKKEKNGDRKVYGERERKRAGLFCFV